jgi:hypothetical protein
MKAKYTLAAAVAVLALATSAGPAFAQAETFTLSLSAPTLVAGKSALLRADGTIPVRDLFFSYWFSVSAIRPAVTTTCPEDHWEAVQLAQSTGGAVIVLSQREIANAATGAFSIPIGITATRPGKLLFCAYTDDGETQTLAATSRMLTIEPASRRTLARARARCMKLHSHSKRAACLKAVRQMATRP